MDFALDQDQQLIADTVRRFADRDLRAWAADADRAGAAPDRFAHVAGELGFFLDAVPADAGGTRTGGEAIPPRGGRAGKGAPAPLEGHRVPADFILARGDKATAANAEVLAWARTSLAARAVGVAVGAMEHADKYAKERVQFG